MNRRAELSQRQKDIRRADALFQIAVQKRDKCLCQRCLSMGINKPSSEAHHIIHKGGGRFSVRWHLGNGVSLCRDCHNLDGSAKGKRVLKEFSFQFIGTHSAMQELILIANTVIGTDAQEEIKRLRRYIKTGEYEL